MKNWGIAGPPEEAYSRVTDAERFRPLHAFALELLEQLEAEYKVERSEAEGLDPELERGGPALVRPTVRITPADSKAAPLTVAFTDFPGLHVRFGRWHLRPFPSCGCDACAEDAPDQEAELRWMVRALVAGDYRESLHVPVMGAARVAAEFSGPGQQSRGWTTIPRAAARKQIGWKRKLVLEWKPWARK